MAIVGFGLVFGLQHSAQADCEDIVAMSKLTVTTVQTKSQLDEYARQFCSDYASYHGNSTEVTASASYKLFSASVGVSTASVDQLASTYCDAQHGNQKRDDAYRQYVESIAPGAYDAYNICTTLKADNIQISVPRASVLPREMYVSVTYSSLSRKAPSHRVQWSASSGVECHWNDEGSLAAIDVPAGTSAVLHCKRVDASKKDVVSIWVPTRAASMVAMPWSAFAKDQPVDQLAALNRQVSDMARELGAVREATSAEVAKAKAAIPRVEQGSVNMGESNENGCPADGYRGLRSQRVVFAAAYSVPPKVAVSITHIDVYTATNVRLRAAVISVDKEGFTYDLTTWCNTHVAGAQMSWLAIGN